jgi:hypothetical protein
VVLNKRERTTAIIVGIGLAIIGIYYFAVDPFLAYRDGLVVQKQKVDQRKKDLAETLRRASIAEKDWKDMLGSSLKDNPTDAAIQAQSDVIMLARECEVGITAIRPESALNSDDKAAFQPQTLRFTGSGSFLSVSKLMLRLENPQFPVKVTAVSLSPHEKPGIDNLQVQLSIATISFNKDVDASKGRVNGASAR